MTDPCLHQPDHQKRLQGGIYTRCEFCGAIKRNDDDVWRRPERDLPPTRAMHRPEEA